MSESRDQTALHLLNNVTLIKNKYDEIAKITGENFNIFKIFGKEYHENYHSAIISDLLDEKGCHGQGRLFLDLFIPIVNKKIVEKNKSNVSFKLSEIIDFSNSTSVTEKVIDDYDRIDIYLSSKNQAIIIENKIGAPFQYRQLKRYFDYASKGKDFVILYLWKDLVTFNEDGFNQEPWPFGKPEENPTEVKAKTISISYRVDIKNWIELSIKECSKLPLIREILIQYLHTINKITEQTTNNKMTEDIIKSIIGTNGNVNKEMIKAFFELKRIQLEPIMLCKLIERLQSSGKFEYVHYKEKEFTGSEFEIRIGKESTEYEVNIYFPTINHTAIIGVYKKDTRIFKGHTYCENDDNNILKQREMLKDYESRNGGFIKTNSSYLNWLWVCNFNHFNSFPWEDRLTDEFYTVFEENIFEVYNNIF